MSGKISELEIRQTDTQDHESYTIFTTLKDAIIKGNQVIPETKESKSIMKVIDETVYELYIHTATLADEIQDFIQVVKKHKEKTVELEAKYNKVADALDSLRKEKSELQTQVED